MVHVDNKGTIDGLWRGEMKFTGPKAKVADWWFLIWGELHRAHQVCILVDGRARQTCIVKKKEKQQLSLFEFFCDLQGRNNNFTNSKTLVGRCRDRP